MRFSKVFIKQQVQEFVRAVFADTLREEGFTSYKNEDFCWFRVVNHEVVHHVFFITPYRHCPIEAFVSCGFYPLYAEIDIPTSPYMYNCNIGAPPFVTQVHWPCEIPWPGNGNVMCSRDDTHGLNLLKEKVLAQFEGMDSALDCYNRHKDMRLQSLMGASMFEYRPYNDFIAEMIYHDDSELYEDFLKAIEKYRRRDLSNTKAPEYVRERLAQLDTWQRAITEDRQPFLDELEKKKADFIERLQKGGIPV